MELLPPKSWKLEFARSAQEERYREITRRHLDEQRKRDDKDRDERERVEDAEEHLLEIVVMASRADIGDFTVTLDHYDAATYEALIQNEQLLAALTQQREEMFKKAFVLPDGRRVFESEDGLHVFDEQGAELDSSLITPEEIEDWRPKYEPVKALGDQIADLTDERESLIRYQQSLDDAREQLEDGTISQQDFDALKGELAESMPDRVRQNLPENYRPAQDAEQETALNVESMPTSRPGIVPGF